MKLSSSVIFTAGVAAGILGRATANPDESDVHPDQNAEFPNNQPGPGIQRPAEPPIWNPPPNPSTGIDRPTPTRAMTSALYTAPVAPQAATNDVTNVATAVTSSSPSASASSWATLSPSEAEVPTVSVSSAPDPAPSPNSSATTTTADDHEPASTTDKVPAPPSNPPPVNSAVGLLSPLYLVAAAAGGAVAATFL